MIVCIHINDVSGKEIVLMFRFFTIKEIVSELKNRENQYHHIFYKTIDPEAYNWDLYKDSEYFHSVKDGDELQKNLYLVITKKSDYVEKEIEEPYYDYDTLDLIAGHYRRE